MAPTPLNILQRHGMGLIGKALQGVVGQASDILVDEARYRTCVIDPVWSLMPLPVRIIGRDRLRWDDIFLSLRFEIFEVQGTTISLRVDTSERLGQIIGIILGGNGDSAYPAPTGGAVDRNEGRQAETVVPPGPPLHPHHGERFAVGIDLGTTFSVIAHLDSAGRPWTITNAEGDLTTASVVLFDGDTIVVGKEAVRAAALEPGRVAQFAKRDMGSPAYSRPINGEYLPPRGDPVARVEEAQGGRLDEIGNDS